MYEYVATTQREYYTWYLSDYDDSASNLDLVSFDNNSLLYPGLIQNATGSWAANTVGWGPGPEG